MGDQSAQTAYDNASKSEAGTPNAFSTKFLCPYAACKTFAVQHWGLVQHLRQISPGSATTRNYSGNPKIVTGQCEACGRESIFIDGKLLIPEESEAPAPAEDLPIELKPDFEEARSVLAKSPRGSSALLRLVIQKLLPFLGSTKNGIDAAIGELVKVGKIKVPIQRALDTVRVVGNESVHPGEMDLRDDREIALALFRIINLIVETEITEPKRLEDLYQSLPQSKLDGIVNRDKDTGAA